VRNTKIISMKSLEDLRKVILLKEVSMDSGTLITQHPPQFDNKNKDILFNEFSNPPNAKHASTLHFTRWKALNLPHNFKAQAVTKVTAVEGPFTYPMPADPKHCIFWHLNFAHGRLFMAYGSSLLAQDEWQVAEHIALGSLREYLKFNAMGDISYMPLTVQSGNPTPCLVRNVERRIAISVDANVEQLRPHALYGNLFAMYILRSNNNTNAFSWLVPNTFL